MTKRINSSIALLLLCAALPVCCTKEKEEKSSGNGPTVTAVTISESALMGDVLSYTVNVQDESTALSTLEAELLFDETVVASESVRTKENGEYSGTLEVPFLKDIPDGNATLRFTATNTSLVKGTLEASVAISRPEFDYLTLTTDSGEEYKMEKTSEKHLYSVSGNFPASLNAKIVSAPFGTKGGSISFAWSNSAIATGEGEYIPFSNGVAGEYEVTLNTLSFAGSPFLTLSFGGATMTMVSTTRYVAFLQMKQGESYSVEGLDISDWTIDPDWFTQNADGSLKSNVIDGYYLVIAETSVKGLTAMVADATGAAGKFDTSTGTGALYLVGTGLGKPSTTYSPGWTPENGICLAPIAEHTFQVTGIAGVSLSTSGIDFKFFGQNDGWGPVELTGDLISSTDETIFVGDGSNGADNGNIALREGKTFDAGGVYVFTITWNGGKGVLTLSKTGSVEIPSEDFVINGTTLTQVDGANYTAVIDFTQGGALSASGFGDFSGWWADTNYLDISNFTFAAVSGKYRVLLNSDSKVVYFRKVKDDGSDGELTDGALYLMGWGVGAPNLDSQFGWNPGSAYCMAQISSGVYQFAGYAGPETGSSVGQYFRTDYLSFKFFGQNGWGTEFKPGDVSLMSELLGPSSDGSNFELASGKTLTNGAVYVLRVDMTGEKPIVYFLQN